MYRLGEVLDWLPDRVTKQKRYNNTMLFRMMMSWGDNVKFSRHKDVKGAGYRHYDDFDAIDVPHTDAIPGDYAEIMGVPLTFLDKHNPEQFEILGLDRYYAGNPHYGRRFTIDGKETYARILIRRKEGAGA